MTSFIFMLPTQGFWDSSLLVLRQEIDGPQAEQLKFLPCGQKLHNSRSERGGWAPPR